MDKKVLLSLLSLLQYFIGINVSLAQGACSLQILFSCLRIVDWIL